MAPATARRRPIRTCPRWNRDGTGPTAPDGRTETPGRPCARPQRPRRRFVRTATAPAIAAGFPNPAPDVQRGITLVELLVVLALLAVLAAVALPNLERLTASMARDTQLEHIKNQIASLGATAMLDGRDYLVLGTDPEATDDLAARLVGRTPYPLDVPDGWRVVIEEPILVRASGVCLGGRVTLAHDEVEPVHVDLEAPFCRVGDAS